MTEPAAEPVDTPDLEPAGTVATRAERLEAILDGTCELLVTTDQDDVITYASARCRELLGVPPESLLQRHVSEMAQRADRDRVSDVAQRARSAPAGRRFSVEYAALLADGSSRMVEADLARTDGATPDIGLVWAIRELGPRHAHDISDAVRHDRLTGLPNRAMLVESLAVALARAGRSGSRLAVAIVQISEFQLTWEQVGHRAAEEMLLTAAGRLTAVARPGDLVARTDIDEFALVLDGFKETDEVQQLIRSALDSLEHPVAAGGRSLELGPRLGASVISTEVDAEELIEQARVAAARTTDDESTSEPVLFSTTMSPVFARADDLAQDLRLALAAGAVRPAYQPVVELGTGRVVGFEALARWHHPERGQVSPAVFIPLAEQHGLITELGRQVMVAACHQLADWLHRFPERELHMAVNVSPWQLAEGTVADDVRRALDDSGLPAEHLVAEVTESALHHDVAAVVQTLGQLRDLGVRTAMDDFGTGFSSLAYLRRLPLDILKIDKSFIDDQDGAGPQLLAAVIGIGVQLGMATVAEGIEQPDQLEAAWNAGCTHGQGFLISRPLDPAAAAALLARSGPIWRPAA